MVLAEPPLSDFVPICPPNGSQLDHKILAIANRCDYFSYYASNSHRDFAWILSQNASAEAFFRTTVCGKWKASPKEGQRNVVIAPRETIHRETACACAMEMQLWFEIPNPFPVAAQTISATTNGGS